MQRVTVDILRDLLDEFGVEEVLRAMAEVMEGKAIGDKSEYTRRCSAIYKNAAAYINTAAAHFNHNSINIGGYSQ